MNKEDFVKLVMAAPALTGRELPRAAVEDVIDAVGQAARVELAGGGEVPLPGIGKLVAETRAARTGRNPRTGKPVDVPEKLVAKLRPGKELKAALNPQTA